MIFPGTEIFVRTGRVTLIALLLAVVAEADATSFPGDPPPGLWPESADAVAGVFINDDAFARLALGRAQLGAGIDWRAPREPGSYRFAAFEVTMASAVGSVDLAIVRTAPSPPAGPFGALATRSMELPAGSLEFDIDGDGVEDQPDLWIEVEPDDYSRLRVRDAADRTWFSLSYPHRWHDEANARTHFRNMDLRLHADAARRLGQPQLAGTSLGGVDLWIRDSAIDADEHSQRSPDGSPQCNPIVWPSPQTPADVAMTRVDFVTELRCRDCDGAGVGGDVVIAPAAELRNIGAADIPWIPKLSGTFPPYGNDQHPYLVWNLYRLDPDQRLRQIGASGLKHAFFASNDDCDCSPALQLYRSCKDIYSAFTNDTVDDIGPRREIIPATGVWMRCGSLYDANCDGFFDNGAGASDEYEFRLLAPESELLPAQHVGARWFMEAWYVVRDDIRRDNSAAFIEVAPQRSAGAWSFASVGEARNGFVHAGWRPAGPSRALDSTATLDTEAGSVLLSARVRRIDGGRYRYDYVMQNIDLAAVESEGTEPDIRLLDENGIAFIRFDSVAGSDVADFKFSDANPAADALPWARSAPASSIEWRAPDAATTQRWGTTYTFGFTTSAAPLPGSAAIGYGDPAGKLVPGSIATLLPLDTSGEQLLRDDFEGPAL